MISRGGSMPKYQCRTDSNQSAIVQAFRSHRCKVLSLHTMGKGCPDLLVCLPDGSLRLVECKSAKGKLTPDQETFISQGWPVIVVREPSQAEAIALGYEG